jgi:hypothetical protein
VTVARVVGRAGRRIRSRVRVVAGVVVELVAEPYRRE